jgi:flagellar export protein FliJ
MAQKGFKFRLERVRAMRERAEDEAKEQLAQAMGEREKWAARFEEKHSLIGSARSASAAERSGSTSIAALRAHEAFVDRTEREALAAELDLSRQDAEVGARRTALQNAARERQVLEKLREKQLDAFRREAERREGNHIDELALAMHRRRSLS